MRKGGEHGDGWRIDIPLSKCKILPSTGLPSRVKDRHGDRQGRLTAIEFSGFLVKKSRKRRAIWLCRCDCGNYINVGLSSTRKPATLSCGCLYYEASLQYHGASTYREGRLKHKVYQAWYRQIKACYFPNSKNYPFCGGRGIKMYARWVNDFTAFLEDVGLPPTPERTILSRIDLDKDFEPNNVYWIDKKTQSKKINAHQQQLREISPPPMPYKDQLIQVVRQNPNASIEEYCELFADATGTRRISRSAMRAKLKKLSLSLYEQRIALAKS